mmetsp:Transcript_30337/g.71530  ORF Transcript_30337/g.71530 Transcript_30337/m.71530 type:complete len:188 (-) Transcript_30337:87-650(-)
MNESSSGRSVLACAQSCRGGSHRSPRSSPRRLHAPEHRQVAGGATIVSGIRGNDDHVLDGCVGDSVLQRSSPRFFLGLGGQQPHPKEDPAHHPGGIQGLGSEKFEEKKEGATHYKAGEVCRQAKAKAAETAVCRQVGTVVFSGNHAHDVYCVKHALESVATLCCALERSVPYRNNVALKMCAIGVVV